MRVPEKDWLGFRPDVVEIIAHRAPTHSEIRMGYGSTHYRTFPRAVWEHPDGRPRRWIKAEDDGLRYYRR